MSVYEDMGLRRVINADGKMTILGSSIVSPEVIGRMNEALNGFFIMDELMDSVGRVIAETTGAEAGCPTCGAASGLAISAAACIAGSNLEYVERMPDSTGLANEIILQKGQAVNFGGKVTQMLRLGGGVPVEVGCSNKVERENIECAINEKTAALVYVKSHHAVQKGMVSLETMIEIAKAHQLPLIMDAAAEEDMRAYVAAGVDMVLYSGGKALSGPTCGFIAGKKKYIDACRKQYKGVGRAMKASKEAMIGLAAALIRYAGKNDEDNAAKQKERMGRMCETLETIPGLSCRVVQDEAGREIYRAQLHVDKAVTGISASELYKRLLQGDPAVYLRGYHMNEGLLAVDPRPLREDEDALVIEKIKACLKQDL
jgi:L-seryl-tRNA(Ser) seleniumtransferase/D-glucosaminate-6-phosphate ammonia-lyase